MAALVGLRAMVRTIQDTFELSQLLGLRTTTACSIFASSMVRANAQGTSTRRVARKAARSAVLSHATRRATGLPARVFALVLAPSVLLDRAVITIHDEWDEPDESHNEAEGIVMIVGVVALCIRGNFDIHGK